MSFNQLSFKRSLLTPWTALGRSIWLLGCALLALSCADVHKSSEPLAEQRQALTVAVPRRIKSLEFSAFRDNDTVHEGNCGSGPVDAETTTDANGGGCNVGWTRAGEWLEYSIQVATTGKYDLTARVASALTGKTFRLALDGSDLAGSLVAPSTGWQAFADRSVKGVNLTAGAHTLRVSFETGDVNLNYLDIAPGRVALPARIEAEKYQRAFETTPNVNSGNACDRGDGVDAQTTTDTAGGGCNIGWTAAGEWLEYDLSVAQAGAFDFTARLASAATGKTVRMSVDGADIGTLSAPGSGAQSFQDRTFLRVNLAAGSHTLRVLFPEGDVGLNFINIVAGPPRSVVPYRIKATDFSAFQESDALHEGNCGSGSVDAETTTDPNGGCNIGWTRAGEWLEYALQVPAAGKYHLTARVASALTGKTFRFLVDSTAVGAATTAPSNGWQAFADRSVKDVQLAAGPHTLRVAFETGDVNLAFVDVSPGTVDLPARLEAENYSRASETTPTVNSGAGCDRGDGVDKENTTDTGGGCTVGWTAGSEWLEYDVKVAQTGAFDVVARVASAVASRTLTVSLDGTLIGTLTLPSSGWATFQDRTLSKVNLTAGQHVFRVVFPQGDANFNYLNVTKAGTPGCTGDAQCSDSNACNGLERCDTSGQCVAGQAPSLDDGNPCTTDACVPATGPSHVAVANGTTCNDANACTLADTCQAGTCQGGAAVACSAQDACHSVGSCNAATGLCSNPLRPAGTSCADGNACNGAETCNALGACASGTPPLVDDGNPCTADSCSPASGVLHAAVSAGTSCADANACNGAEACDGSGTCRAGTAPTVDDGNPCTVDSCDPSQGVRHVAAAAGTSCTDANACNGAEACDGAGSCRPGTAPVVDDGNPCTVDSCSASQGVQHVAAATGTACDDATVCNGRETCNGQAACVAGVAPTVDDDNPCTADACDAAGGVTHVALSAGSTCSNDDACDGEETCNGSGSCVAGGPPQLDDQNPCTADSCDPATGARHLLLAVGSACSTGDCRIEGKCDAQGACAGGPPRDIEDGNPCTVDSCDAAGGVAHQPLPVGTACSDGNVCNGAEACTAQAACVAAAPPALDDDNPCTIDSCDATFGVAHVPAPVGRTCDDANLCNGRETCDGFGVCASGSAPSVDDGNACTTDQCDPTAGVSHVASASGFPCKDSDACNGDEACNGAGQCLSGTPPALDDGNPCTADSCDVSSGVLHAMVANGTACSAADACHAAGVCNAGVCNAGATVTIDDGNPCTADACSTQSGVVHTPLPAGSACANSNACDGAEICNGAGACSPGTAPVVDDGNPCTTDSCDASTGVSHAPVALGSACADGNACNGAETCNASGVCQAGTAPSVNDGNPCTTDACDPVQGVTHSPKAAGTDCSDGNLCNGLEACTAGGQCQPGTPPQVADTNPCTDDTCDAATGVQHASRPAGTSCSDGNPCNGAETCSAQAVCTAGTPLDPNDGDPCTVDSCQAGGVVHTPAPNGTSCTDGNACNGAELCQTGTCRAGSSVSTDDANPCTVDACNPGTGAITHNPVAVGTACDNATVCDGRETCNAQGACTSGAAPLLDDGNPCTADACNSATGVSHAPVATGTACDDATLCNGREVCSGGGVCAAGSPPVIDDGNACTADSCDALVGPRHTPLAAGTSCSDGDACNGLEACSGSGVCQAGAAPVLDDGNPCTVDSCSPGAGSVQHTPLPNGSSCPDQNVCNGSETCNMLGVCSPGTPANVDDGNACTADSCDPLSGVRHVPLSTPECQARAGWAQLLSSQPSPRDGAAGTFIGTGELLLFGGDNAGAMLGDAWLWSPASRSWRRAASGPTPRAGAAMAYDSQRKVAVLFGGVDGALVTAAYLNDVWEYDASTDRWTQRIATGEAPPARALAAFAFDSSRGRALMFGGVGSSAFADTWEWNAAQARWTQLAASGPSARFGAAFAFDAVSSTYALFGGSPGNASGALDDSWTLNATTGVWQRLSPTQKPPARAGAALAFDPVASRFVLVGGTGTPSVRFDDTWELNTASGAWQQLQLDRTPSADTGGVLAFDAQSNRLTFASGLSYSASGVFTPQSNAVWQLDRQAARWTDSASRQAPTELRLGAAFDSRAQTIVALGPVPPPERPLMWSFEPRASQWTAQDITDVDHPFSDGDFDLPQPGATNLFYSAPLGRLISLSSNMLLEFDGKNWSRRCTFADVAQGPPRLAYTSVAFDAAMQRIYETGGSYLGSQQRNNQTFRIDITTCQADIAPVATQTPKSLEDSVAVWDSNRGRLIQFGGAEYVSNWVYSAETWELDPSASAWTKFTGAAPAGRNSAAAVYDPVRRRVILHGGLNASGRLFDTWELDPEVRVWTQLQTTGPAPGEQASLVFDEVRQTPALVSTRGAVWHLVAGVWNADLNPIAPSARSGMSGGWSPISGLGMFFGGTSGDGQRDFLGDLWLWRDGWRGVYPGADGSSLIASGQATGGELNNVPASRTGHVFATGLVRFGTTHTALLFGGEGGSDQFYGLFGDTWTFDETAMQWHAAPKTLETNPTRGRTGHAISVVPTRGYLMFGGLTRDKVQVGSGSLTEQRNLYLNETTLWQPSGWTSLSSSNPPSPRYGHAMVTDEFTNEIILFGGRTAEGLSGETWALSLNGLGSTANWRKLSPPTSPLPRFGHSMAYDPVRKKVVLTGGEGASAGQSFGDTWEWDSATQRWTARNIQPLEGRAGHVTFFDRTRAQLIAFGGFAHRDNGKFALTYGDTLAFVRPTEADSTGGFPNGSRCTAASECSSGNCVDGFCCNASCAGQCGACDVSGSEGTCTAVQGTPHGARPSCGGSGGQCATQCNGADMTQCNAPPVGTPCGPAVPACVGDNTLITEQGSCDAGGSCVVPQVSCGAYICCDGIRCVGLPKQCVTNCQGADSLCAIGYKCNGSGPPPRGQCYKPAQITSFSSNPTSAKVGVPMTFTVAATGTGTSYQWLYKYQSANTVFPACSGTTCNWTPVAADAGKTITWTINVVAPSASTTSDDTRSLVFTVQP